MREPTADETREFERTIRFNEMVSGLARRRGISWGTAFALFVQAEHERALRLNVK